MKCEGAPRGVSRRDVTAAMASDAAARPNRASQSRWSGSVLVILPVATKSVIFAELTGVGLLSVSVNVSLLSSCTSSRRAIVTVLLVSPGWKVSVPLAAV